MAWFDVKGKNITEEVKKIKSALARIENITDRYIGFHRTDDRTIFIDSRLKAALTDDTADLIKYSKQLRSYCEKVFRGN